MRYKELYISSYVVYALAFLLPAHVSQSSSFCCGGTEIWFGWKCCLAVFSLIFMTGQTFTALLLFMPNILMVLSIFFHKRANAMLLLLMALFNLLSSSFWWIMALNDGNINNLLFGYWLWYLSIIGNNAILLINKKNIN